MLKQSDNKSSEQKCLTQAVLKHRVRNLRAKIQSLLPLNSCQKISKRNHRLKKQFNKLKQMKQEDYLSKTISQEKWKYSYFLNPNIQYNIIKQIEQNKKEYNFLSMKNSIHKHQRQDTKQNRDQRYYFDGISSNNHTLLINLKDYHFQKLTNEQIQQIQEDKIYYLGSHTHIQAYQMFIKNKKKSKEITQIANQEYNSFSIVDIEKITQNQKYKNKHKNKIDSNVSFDNYRDNFIQSKQNQYQNQYQDNNKNDRVKSFKSIISQSCNMTLRASNNYNKSSKNINKIVNNNIVRLNEEQKIKRILLSMQLKNRQQRIQQNFHKLNKIRKEEIQNQNKKEKIKIIHAQEKKRKIHNEVGEIVNLAEKLRKKCIQKKVVIQPYQNKLNTSYKQNNN